MADLAPYSWNWQREYEEIRAELTRRWKYRMGGRPYPTELTNAEEIIQTLERMVPILKRRINEELKEQAVSAMQKIAKRHQERLTTPTKQPAAGHGTQGMPRTSSELQLEQVRIMQHWAEKDAKDQDHARFKLTIHKYCETDCPYPDVCDDTKWRHGCLLKQLSQRVEVQGFLAKRAYRRRIPSRICTPSSGSGKAGITNGTRMNRSCGVSGNTAASINPSCAGIGHESFWDESITAAGCARRARMR